MPPLSYRALAIAFGAEFIVDSFVGGLVFQSFAQLDPGAEISPAALEQAARIVFETTAYLPVIFVLGTATTIGGAWLAARLARRIPYYHGLAMGMLGLVQTVLLWRGDLTLFNVLGVLTTIPASLYGAHLARKQLPAE
jgi:hypothetical protein